MKLNKNILLIHCCFWIINSVFNAVFWGVNVDISFFFMVVPFYINYFILVPKLLTKNKTSFFALWFVLVWGIMIGTFLGYYVFVDCFISRFPNFNFKRIFAISGYISFYYISISTGGRLFLYWLKNIKRNNDLIREKTSRQVQLMKSNINIPFVVNTLEYAKLKSLSEPRNAESPIILLSNVLRYGLYETQSDFNPLHRELDVLEDYIQLQNQIEARFSISLNVSQLIDNVDIVPNILIRFVGFWKENFQNLKLENQEITIISQYNKVEILLPVNNLSLDSPEFTSYEDEHFSVKYVKKENKIALQILNLSI